MTFRSGWYKDARQKHDDIAAMVQAYADNAVTIEELKRAVHWTPVGSLESIESTLRKLEASNTTLGHALKNMAPPKYFNYTHDARSSMTADNFFDITEITETVLGFLPLPDLLVMQQVSKRLFAIIEGSSKLRGKLKMYPEIAGEDMDEDVNFYHTRDELRFPGIEASYYGGRDGSRTPESKMEIESRHELWNAASKPGRRLRELLVLTPSLEEMCAKPLCCNVHVEPTIVSNKSGITLGDLYDTNISLQAEHVRCPFAMDYKHAPDGSVRVDVMFYAAMPSDVVAASRERRGPCGGPFSPGSFTVGLLGRPHIEAYRRAKHKAYVAGLTIPSLAEFEASLDHVEDAMEDEADGDWDADLEL